MSTESPPVLDRPAASTTTLPSDLAGLQTQIGENLASQTELDTVAATIPSLATTLAQLQTQIGENLASQTELDAVAATIPTLATTLAQLQTQIADDLASQVELDAVAASIPTLATTLNELQTQIGENLASQTALDAVAATIPTLATTLAQLQTQIGENLASQTELDAVAATIPTLATTLAQLQTQISENLASQTELDAVAATIPTLATTLAQLQTQIGENLASQTELDAVAATIPTLATTLAQLQTQIGENLASQTELDAVAATITPLIQVSDFNDTVSLTGVKTLRLDRGLTLSQTAAQALINEATISRLGVWRWRAAADADKATNLLAGSGFNQLPMSGATNARDANGETADVASGVTVITGAPYLAVAKIVVQQTAGTHGLLRWRFGYLPDSATPTEIARGYTTQQGAYGNTEIDIQTHAGSDFASTTIIHPIFCGDNSTVTLIYFVEDGVGTQEIHRETRLMLFKWF